MSCPAASRVLLPSTVLSVMETQGQAARQWDDILTSRPTYELLFSKMMAM